MQCTLACFALHVLLLSHLQDIDQLTDPNNGYDGINVVAQILWEAYKTRYDTGVASLLLFAIPMGANFLSALHAVTAASR